MATQVQIVMPTPNHRRIRVEFLNVNEFGVEKVDQSQELSAGQVSEILHIHRNRRIKIIEID